MQLYLCNGVLLSETYSFYGIIVMTIITTKTKKLPNNLGKLTLISSLLTVVLSACGGSDSPSVVTPPVITPPVVEPPVVATFPTQVEKPNMMVVNDSGSLILAESGLSLYTFDSDSMNTSTCVGTADDTETCAGKWPPLLVSDGAVADNTLTIITRPDDTEQWAYKGQPLYQWYLDIAQGDIGGDGIGNVWHLARPMPLKTAMINERPTYVGNQVISTLSFASSTLTAERSDKNNLTLYTFDNDPIDASACVGECINNWPPLLADAGAMAKAPLSLVEVNDNNMQWAYKGKPLYFFKNDTVAGDITGDEIANIWHVASQEPAVLRTTDNGRSLSATGKVNALIPVGESITEFAITKMDRDGFNLYTFDNDSTEASNCEGQCLVNWPAFLPNEGEVAVGDFTIFERSDGTKQWAHQGMPVYFFIGDTARGDINGEGLGGVWHLIEPAAETPQPGVNTTLVEEINTLGATITVNGSVHLMLRDTGTNEFIDAVIDKSGFALYTFDNDTAGVSNCFDGCLDSWPPLLASSTDTAEAPFSIIERDNSMMQWAINDMPLYFFTPDTSADDINGENANNVWHIARPAPVKVDEHATKGVLLAAHGNVLASQGKTSAQLTGLTLYTFDSDVKDSGESECFNSCAVTWPPLYATSADEAFGNYTIITRDENSTTTFQWSYNGLPLYFFVGDSNVGDTGGDYPTWTIARP